MSRDIFVQDIPDGITGGDEIPDGWMPRPLPFGPAEVVVRRLLDSLGARLRHLVQERHLPGVGSAACQTEGMAHTPRLFALSGLPGAGKSTAARALARQIGSVVVSVDPIEDALHRAGLTPSHETGLAAYLVAEVVARDALTLRLSVIVDAANYVEEARAMWRDLAHECSADLTWVDVTCSDEALHRQRIQARDRGFGPTLEPNWQHVLTRRSETEPWSAHDRDRMVHVDTVFAMDAQLADLLMTLPARRGGTAYQG